MIKMIILIGGCLLPALENGRNPITRSLIFGFTNEAMAKANKNVITAKTTTITIEVFD